MSFPICEICRWRRNCVKARPGEESDAPFYTCDSIDPAILRHRHTLPDITWQSIISTDRLCSGIFNYVRNGRMWARFPLRCDPYVEQSNCCYKYEGQWRTPHETVVAYHNTYLERLVSPTRYLDGSSIGEGILFDGRLRYGDQCHGGSCGVHVFSDGGLETFIGNTGWVQLEVHCTNTMELKRGRRNRYCINGPKGEICEKASIVAIWILHGEVPPILAV